MEDGPVTSERTIAGRYAILREIGRGGMATVCVARDLESGSLVAIKMLREDIASSVNTERFLREVGVAGTLDHPRILRLLDSGQSDDGLPYYVMPFVEGETLRQRLDRQKQLPVDEALAIVAQIADALAFAHDRGVLHRDVTPANILLKGDEAFLSDFGIARAITGSAGETLTSTGVVIGTPEYMSPEQGAGDHRPDARSDLFSLASVLYVCLAGEPPYTGPTPQAVLARKATSRAPSVRELRPLVPQNVARAIARGLEPVPADRYRSVRDFAAALAAPEPERVVRKAAHVRWLVASTVVLVAAVAAFASGMGRDRVASARREMEGGRVAKALGMLRATVAGDSANANAALWLAQGLILAGEDTAAEWRRLAKLSVASAGALSPADKQRVVALAAMAEKQFDVACPTLRALQRDAPKDLSIVFDLAECIAQDRAVLADPASPSGWRFRASWTEAKYLYDRLIDDLPAGHETRAVVFRRIPMVLLTEWGQYRRGQAADDSSRGFGAFPDLVHLKSRDSIAYVPYPSSEFGTDRSWTNPSGLERAIESDRTLSRKAALTAVRDEPGAADAHEALARVLELNGELRATALDSGTALFHVRAARTLSKAPLQDLRLRAAEVRIRVKREEFGTARALADSTIALWPKSDKTTTAQVAPLMALVGHARELAAHLAGFAAGNSVRMPDGRRYSPHPVLGATTLALYAYAAIGGPVDSLVTLQARAERQLRSFAPTQALDSIRTATLARSLSLAVPALGRSAVARLSRSTPLIGAQLAWARKDHRAVRAILDSLRDIRSGHTTAAARFDQIYQEAWLRVAIGDSAAAARQLDDALGGLPALGALFLTSIPEAGAFGRALLLRAQLATQQGDAVTSRRWSSAARDILGGADADLRPH